jgi:translation elongation factor EF-Tu-like GTPase
MKQDADLEKTLLYIVEDAFQISGRGCVLASGIPEDSPVQVRNGDVVMLVQPSGKIFESVIHSLDAIHNRSVDKPEVRTLVVLPKSVHKQDVPAGSKLFLLASTQRA